MADYDWVLYPLLGAGAIIIALVVLYATRMKEPKKLTTSTSSQVSAPGAWIQRVEKTVTSEEAQGAKDRLKMLDLEREILSSAIRRLYEAQAEGKITEEERERIGQRYKSRMMKVRDNITKSESVVALHELESMQDDLIKLFSERFDDLGKKVEELRGRLEIKAEKEEAATPSVITPTQLESESEEEEEKEKGKERKRPRKKSTPAAAPKTDADKRIDEIRAEVEKVLERLGQIEVEGEG